MKVLIIDESGNILRSVFCSTEDAASQAHGNETVIEDIWVGTDDSKHRIVDGKRIEFVPEPAPPLPVKVQRARAYRPVGDQLDDLWRAMDAGILPMVPAFYDPIKAVKDRIPK